MMTELKGSLYTAYAQYRNTYLAFWAFVILFIALNVIIISLFDNVSAQLTISAPVYILSLIIPWLMLKQTIPYLVKVSSTRLSAYLGVGIFLFIATIGNVFIVQVIIRLFGAIFNYENGSASYMKGEGAVVLNNVLNHTLLGLSSWQIIMIDLMMALILTSFSLSFAIIFKRYGKLIGFLVVGLMTGLIILVATTGTASHTTVKVINFIVDHAGFYYVYVAMGFSFLVYAFNYIFLRKLIVK